MIVFLFGQDSYRITKKKQELVTAYQKKHGGIAYEEFDLAEKECNCVFEEFLLTQSMFSSKKLAVVKNIEQTFDIKKTQTLFKKYLTDDDVVLIGISDKKPSVKWSFLIKEPSKSQEFKELEREKLEMVVYQEGKQQGFSFTEEDVRILINNYGNDMWVIMTELEKISFSKEIPIISKACTNYFMLTQRLKNGKTCRERIIALERLLSEYKEDPARIFNGMAYKVFNKVQAQQYADYDILIKKGQADYDDILLNIALQD
ncbi:MAG: hypothetical protein V1652_00745 [bacterium]